MGFINKIGAFFGSSRSGNPVFDQAFAAIEEALGPQVLALPDSRQRLEPAVAHALSYFSQAITLVPGPVDLAASRYSSDPRMQALFQSASDIGDGMGRSMALRDALGWFSEHGHETVYALMGMRLGTADTTAGNNGPADHTFRSLGIDDQDVRVGLREAAFSALIKGFAADLKERHREWRLQNTEKQLRDELHKRDAGGNQDPIDLHLARAGDQFTLGRMLQALVEWLEGPERQLRIEAGNPSVLVPATIAGENPFHLPQLMGIDRRKWLICTVRFPLVEAVNAVARETRAHRYILI